MLLFYVVFFTYNSLIQKHNYNVHQFT